MPESMSISPEPKYQEPRVTRLEMVLKETSTYFNTELKKAIADGRLKINEDDILEAGPNYSHTTNGKELEYQQRRIFVGHLPVDFLSKDEIYYMFEKYGTIIAIRNVLKKFSLDCFWVEFEPFCIILYAFWKHNQSSPWFLFCPIFRAWNGAIGC